MRHLPVIAAVAVIAVVGVVAAVATSRPAHCLNFNETNLSLDGNSFPVAVADDAAERTRGLSGCTQVPDNTGLYFPYDEARATQFWMKGMTIPIDIIWIRDGRVVGVDKHVQPEPGVEDENLTRYPSPGPVTAVLEVKAGGAGEYGIGEGSIIMLTR